MLTLSEIIQSGILFTLLGLAFGLGKVWQKIEHQFKDHEKRLGLVEKRLQKIA